MKEISGHIIDISIEHKPVRGCTISKQLHSENGNEISIYSCDKNTDISAERYEYHKLIKVESGSMEVYDTKGKVNRLKTGDCTLTPTNIPVGVRTDEGCIYTEIGIRKDSRMNEIIKAGEVFKLAELLPYQDDKIVNMDIVRNEKMKFVLMSFDKGTGLSEHAAPGEALVFALEGEATIGYEGKDYIARAGETFKFDKFGKHSVTANDRFKMALLLVLE